MTAGGAGQSEIYVTDMVRDSAPLLELSPRGDKGLGWGKGLDGNGWACPMGGLVMTAEVERTKVKARVDRR